MTNRSILDITKGVSIEKHGYYPGFYWNEDLGLISISADGEEWITFADKDLGAIDVGYGGNTFQWGNNYAFPEGYCEYENRVKSCWGYIPYTSNCISSMTPYIDSTFRNINNSSIWWSKSDNDNLWSSDEGYFSSMYLIYKSKLESIINICTTLGLSSSDMKNYLKIPSCGYRNQLGEVVHSNGFYLRIANSISKTDDNLGTNARCYSDSGFSSLYRNCACPVRCYLGLPVAPDGTWTTLYDGSSVAQGAGIFRDETNGYISLSDTGNYWLTISDKNMGATEVRNPGDPVTKENSGLVYQWGNFYGFPSTLDSETEIVMSDQQVYTSYGVWGNDRRYYSNDTLYYYSNYGQGRTRALNLSPNLRGSGLGNFATQGPCPDGYHIPTYNEAKFLIDVYSSFEYFGPITRNLLWNLFLVGSNRIRDGAYERRSEYRRWLSDTGEEAAWFTTYSNLEFRLDHDWLCLPLSQDRPAHPNRCLYIRPFKNTPVIPDDSWTVIFTEHRISPGIEGIYHNASLGLISLTSDGETRITMADKNLGATELWDGVSVATEANSGYYYQWGNNYGFPGIGGGDIVTSTTRVSDVSSYGPGNYYNRGVFVTPQSSPRNWFESINNNLWGDTTDTLEARKGPCPNGYHVPTYSEWTSVNDIRVSLGLGTDETFRRIFKIPYNGYRSKNNGSITANYSTYGNFYFWTSSSDNPKYGSRGITYFADGYAIRPFKNDSVIPDSTRTKIY